MKYLFWFIYFPVLRILVFLLAPVRKIQERVAFEKKNLTERSARSFKKEGMSADHAFEFSSEGEFQQVASLIEDALLAKKKIELVFFSPSVEKAVIALADKYPQQIRYLRYPLLTMSPSCSFLSWTTSKVLTLVRYDFFPEFLLYPGELNIIWATFKRERLKNKSASAYKLAFYNRAQKIIFASKADLAFADGLGLSGKLYNFRVESIRRRLLSREQKFQSIFPLYPKLKSHLTGKRVIIGNAWPVDLDLLKGMPQDWLLLIVPHQLEASIITAFENGLKEQGREVLTINDANQELQGNTFILNKKGVLCELYQDFDFAYVGGGLGVSVHSILEPLVAGCTHIASGPLHHRSTEYDMALALGRMTEVKNSPDFLTWLDKKSTIGNNGGDIAASLGDYQEFRKDIILC
jgi:3-deoxy-D-manno-octulosonic-acid transferase